MLCLGQNDKNAQAKQKKKKMTDEEILSRLSKNKFWWSYVKIWDQVQFSNKVGKIAVGKIKIPT